MSASPLPTQEQIKRLKSLQGVDSGVFTLAVFSTIEGFIRDKLNKNDDRKITFPELIEMFKTQFSVHHPKEYSLFKDIKNNHNNANRVRHRFDTLTLDEANCALSNFLDFASIFSLPNFELIKQLEANLNIWKERKISSGTSIELDKANQEIKKLSQLNANMAKQVEELEGKKKELELLSSKLKTLQLEYDSQIEKNKTNKERIDELRREKNNIEQENRKAQKELQLQIEKLSDAENYIDNLSRMTSYTRTRYDYEQSLLRLTSQQQAIVDQVKFSRDFLIKGSAGTGKSLVLLKTLERLVAQNRQSLFDGEKTIRLITYTRSLEKYNKYVAGLLKIENPLEEEIILTSESYLNKILKDAFPDININYSFDKSSEIKTENPLGNEIWSEIENFILPKCVTKKEYCEERIPRTGMKKAQGAGNRQKIWEAVEEVFSKWEENDTQYIPYVTYKLDQKIKSGEYTIPDELKTDYLFVDEAQDLTPAKLRILKASVRESVILAGDNDQSLFQPGFTWNRAGIDVSGNTRILNVNFRSTNQINEVAEKYRATIHGFDKENRPETFRLGPPVELHESKNDAEAFFQIISAVKMCINLLNYDPENICLIVQQNRHLEKLSSLLKSELDLDSASVGDSNFDFSKPGIVRLSTTHSCKGLDFPVVLFYLDHRVHHLTGYDDETTDRLNRNLIYTAITRSTEMLHVFTLENSSAPAINDLKDILKND